MTDSKAIEILQIDIYISFQPGHHSVTCGRRFRQDRTISTPHHSFHYCIFLISVNTPMTFQAPTPSLNIVRHILCLLREVCVQVEAQHLVAVIRTLAISAGHLSLTSQGAAYDLLPSRSANFVCCDSIVLLLVVVGWMSRHD